MSFLVEISFKIDYVVLELYELGSSHALYSLSHLFLAQEDDDSSDGLQVLLAQELHLLK